MGVDWGTTDDWAADVVVNRGSGLYGEWSSGGVDNWCIK